MPILIPFPQFFLDLASGVHDFSSDTLGLVLTNVAPTITDEVLADITQIANGNGYTTGGTEVANAAVALDGNVAEIVGDDVTFTASSSTMATWRYGVVYNNTPTSPADPLIGYIDAGAAISLPVGAARTFDFSAATGFLRIGVGTVA